jgi:hypothetical protein
MKKLIGLLLVLAGLTFAMPAQSQIKWGVKGGLNLSQATFSQSDLNSKNRTGFFIGPMVDINVPIVGIDVDGALLYSQRGLKVDDNSSSVTVKAIEIPLNLKYNLGLGSMAGIFFAAGPQFDFNVDKNVSDNLRNYTFKSSTLSFNLGAGLKLLNHLQLGVNYNIPLGRTADYNRKTAENEIYNCKSKTWQVSVAYLF